MRVVVCGAGIAGLTFAWWAAEAGFDVLVVERAERLRDQGYMIDFFGPGWEVADRMGLIASLDAVRYPIPKVVWVDRLRRVTARLDYQRMERLLSGRLMSIMRGDLERALFLKLPKTVEVRFGRSVLASRDVGSTIKVDLDDGLSERADLLVAADGVHSTIRDRLFKSDPACVRCLPYQTAAFIFEDSAAHTALDGQFRLISVPGRQVGFYPLRSGRVASFFAHRSATALLPDDPIEELRRVYGDLDWLVRAALEQAQAADVYYDNVAQVELPRWGSGRTVLVGDAGYAVSLLAGQGASLAMAGAYILAEELTRSDDIRMALRWYESRLQPTVTSMQAAGRRAARWLVPSTRLELGVRNAALRLAALPGLSPLLGAMFLSGRHSAIGPDDPSSDG